MKGIQFVHDESGERTAVLIDLREWGAFWEDIYNGLIAESRKNNEKIEWDAFEEEPDNAVFRVTLC